MVYTEFIDINAIYNFVAENLFIWDCLGGGQNICFKFSDYETFFELFLTTSNGDTLYTKFILLEEN